MGEKQKNEGGLRLFRRGWLLLLGAAVGVLLILVGNGQLFSDQKDKTSEQTVQTDPLLAYATLTEQKIASLCSQGVGVSEVQVVVTLEGDFTYVYATESKTVQKEGVSESHTSYVTVGSGANEQTVLLTRTYPRVSGIGVVCRGGGDARVRRELIALLEAAYGISSNHNINICKILTSYKTVNPQKITVMWNDVENLTEPLTQIGFFDFEELHFEVYEGKGGHLPGEIVLIDYSKHIAITGDIYINTHGLTAEQAEYNQYAPILMTSVDTDSKLCVEERKAIMQRLGVGKWQIFGAHGFKKDYSVNS